jgi:hypothetical protein
MITLALAMMSASYADICTVAVFDYAEESCYLEDAMPNEASCSEFRVYFSFEEDEH